MAGFYRDADDVVHHLAVLDRRLERLARGAGGEAFVDGRPRFVLQDVPGLALEVRFRVRVGVVLIGMNLHREIFAGVQEFDEDGELALRSGERHIAEQVAAKLLHRPVERPPRQRPIGNFGTHPVGGIFDHSRWKIV